jgi:dTDP-4-amino-4,6-dideoxygalactose transaminase
VLPDNSAVAAVEQQRFHGIRRDADGSMDVLFAGAKSNLSDVAAAVGLAQLARLEGFNARRRELVALYYERLRLDGAKDAPAFTVPDRGDAGHSWHIFAPLLPLARLRIDRAGYIAAMRRHDIAVGIHYPALHLFSHYRAQGWRPGDFPNAERIGESIVTLPLFPSMHDQDVDRVINASRAVFAEHCR